MIHVCFGLYDKTGRYSKFTGTTLLSLFENTNAAVTAHILHDNTLTQDNREKFIYLAGQYNQRIKFYNVESLCADKIAEIKSELSARFASEFSVAAMYRFLIPQLLPADTEKAIYLDSDLIVNLDIKELWRIELGDKILAVIPEIANYKSSDRMRMIHFICREGFVNENDYFNSGVLLINLKAFALEMENFSESMKFIGNHSQYVFFDQDILNHCFSTRTLKLPVKFNRFVWLSNVTGNREVERAIYHYLPKPQALGLDMNIQLNRLWLSYFMKTPWFDEDAIGRLYAGFQQIHVGLKQAMVHLSAIMSGKTRAFFALPNDVDGLKRFFSIRNDEKIIPADSQDAIQKLLDAMKKARGKRLFFIMVPGLPLQILTEAGFLPGKDFVNGLEFLSEAQGLPLNSYKLIQTM